MATLTVRNLPDDVRDRIRMRAAAHGRSMEAEVREMLRQAVVQTPEPDALERQRRKLDEARAIIRRHVAAGESVVDEFLRERRSMWGEQD